MKISLREVGGSEVLAGALAGRAVFREILSRLDHDATSAEPLFLDFSEVSVATASFLRESALALKAYMRAQKSSYYPVIANASAVVLDEMDVLLRDQNDAILICSLDDDDLVSELDLVGGIDQRYRATLELIMERGEVDATALAGLSSVENQIGQTGWNNRLTALVRAGLLAERTVGRTKYYRAILEGN